MFRYYTWALTEKTLSLLPGGQSIYKTLGRIVKRDTLGTKKSFTTFPLIRKAREVTPAGGSVLEVGTGWFHHDAFLLYLVGDYKVFLFDLEDKARLNYIRNYLRTLLSNIEVVADELGIDQAEATDKLQELLGLQDRSSIYSRCNFAPCFIKRPDHLFLPENSIDFMLSRCVLGHIRPEILVDELIVLRRILKDDGYMYHLIGHDDHWAFHDRSMRWPSFNYLRYSERAYRLLFDTKLEYHNRLVRPEWLPIFDRCGLHVEEYNAHITDLSRKNVSALQHIDSRYAKYPLDDIAIIYSYVLLRKAERTVQNRGVDPLGSVTGEPSRRGSNSPPMIQRANQGDLHEIVGLGEASGTGRLAAVSPALEHGEVAATSRSRAGRCCLTTGTPG